MGIRVLQIQNIRLNVGYRLLTHWIQELKSLNFSGIERYVYM